MCDFFLRLSLNAYGGLGHNWSIYKNISEKGCVFWDILFCLYDIDQGFCSGILVWCRMPVVIMINPLIVLSHFYLYLDFSCTLRKPVDQIIVCNQVAKKFVQRLRFSHPGSAWLSVVWLEVFGKISRKFIKIIYKKAIMPCPSTSMTCTPFNNLYYSLPGTGNARLLVMCH